MPSRAGRRRFPSARLRQDRLDHAAFQPADCCRPRANDGDEAKSARYCARRFTTAFQVSRLSLKRPESRQFCVRLPIAPAFVRRLIATVESFTPRMSYRRVGGCCPGRQPSELAPPFIIWSGGTFQPKRAGVSIIRAASRDEWHGSQCRTGCCREPRAARMPATASLRVSVGRAVTPAWTPRCVAGAAWKRHHNAKPDADRHTARPCRSASTKCAVT